MKKLFLLLALWGMVAVGCSKDEGGSENNIPENIFFGLDKESVTIAPDGGSVDVIVYSNYKWEISGTSDWCTPSAKSGDANEDGQKVTFSADVAYDDREATFWFRCADKQIKFVVSQKSNDVTIYYTSSNGKIVTPYNIPAFDATIVSNTYKDGVGVIEFDGAITTIGDYAFYNCGSLTSVTIPNSVTTIGDEAFCDCSNLTSVTIPDNVTTIGDYAFYGCSSLTSVTIGDSVTTIGKLAFYKCSSLQEFNGKFASEDGRCLIIDGVLNSFAIGCGATEYTIPNSVTTIGEWAFYGCSNLTNVTIPDSVTEIGGIAFGGCNIQEFKGKFASEDGRCLIIDGVLNSFAPAGLTEYTIPDSVTAIGEAAFQGCESLTSVTIPDSVTTIGWYAFGWCDSLTSVYCQTTTPPAALLYNGYWDAFDDNAPGRKIYVPMGSVYKYKSAEGWSDYADAIEGYNF